MFLLHSVCIEVRKNLRCVNIFLRFHTPASSEIKLTVEHKAFRVEETGHILQVNYGFFTAEAHTFTNLVVDKCNVSFRLSLVKLEEKKCDLDLGEKYVIKSFMEQGATTVISCVNCHCELTTKQVFNRILEFPSAEINLSDFFCHSHHLGKDSLTLVPKTTEHFYGFDFVVLNREVLLNVNVREKECHLYCRRCLQYLGETLFEGKAVKLWTDALWHRKYSANIIVIDEPFPKATPHELLLKLINDTSNHSSVEQMLFRQIQFTKVLIGCSFPNRKKKFLLLHILEREIVIFRNTCSHTDSKPENNNLINVELNPWKCIKLYYRCISESNGDNTKKAEEVLDAWKVDISIHNMNISPRLFCVILKELMEHSFLLPQIYRQCTDEFLLSFIFY